MSEWVEVIAIERSKLAMDAVPCPSTVSVATSYTRGIGHRRKCMYCNCRLATVVGGSQCGIKWELGRSNICFELTQDLVLFRRFWFSKRKLWERSGCQYNSTVLVQQYCVEGQRVPLSIQLTFWRKLMTKRPGNKWNKPLGYLTDPLPLFHEAVIIPFEVSQGDGPVRRVVLTAHSRIRRS